jgi:hypothetical protein
LCNPACLRMFAQEPDPYLARLARRMREHQRLESPNPECQMSGLDEGFRSEAAYQVLGAKRAMGTVRSIPQSEAAC